MTRDGKDDKFSKIFFANRYVGNWFPVIKQLMSNHLCKRDFLELYDRDER